jgi:hypothetical protein
VLSEHEYFEDDAADRRAAAAIAARLSDQLEGFTSRADVVYLWLRQRESLYPVHIKVGDPTVAPQDDPSAGVPATRTGADMAVTMTDTQQAVYPPAEAVDSRGFQVPSDAITVTEDSGGAVVALTVGSDGTATFVAVAPGSATGTWTDTEGQTFADSINVTAGPAVGVTVGAPTVEDQPTG